MPLTEAQSSLLYKSILFTEIFVINQLMRNKYWNLTLANNTWFIGFFSFGMCMIFCSVSFFVSGLFFDYYVVYIFEFGIVVVAAAALSVFILVSFLPAQTIHTFCWIGCHWCWGVSFFFSIWSFALVTHGFSSFTRPRYTHTQTYTLHLHPSAQTITNH